MNRFHTLMFVILYVSVFISCSHEKYPLPSIPEAEDRYSNIGKEVYNLINPILDAEHGYDFNQPSDIYFGVDNFLYICDTGNDRIVMMDAGGSIQGILEGIPHPEAVTQNDSLQLLVVNKTNRIFRIDLFAADHIISNATIDTVFEQGSEPTREFTGITVYNGFEYYVTVVDVADSNTNYLEFSFIYDFRSNHELKGPLPLHRNGTALFGAIVPTSIVSYRERFLDISAGSEDTRAFLFTQKGETSLLKNSFKVQEIATTQVEGQEVLIPNTGFIGTDIYTPGKYHNPEDVALDRQGYIFVVDAGRGISDPDTTKPAPGFYRFSPMGSQLQEVTGPGTGEKEFNHPSGIAVAPFLEEQIVYVADTGNNRIMMFQLSTE